jgi:hypothetical protein
MTSVSQLRRLLNPIEAEINEIYNPVEIRISWLDGSYFTIGKPELTHLKHSEDLDQKIMENQEAIKQHTDTVFQFPVPPILTHKNTPEEEAEYERVKTEKKRLNEELKKAGAGKWECELVKIGGS